MWASALAVAGGFGLEVAGASSRVHFVAQCKTASIALRRASFRPERAIKKMERLQPAHDI